MKDKNTGEELEVYHFNEGIKTLKGKKANPKYIENGGFDFLLKETESAKVSSKNPKQLKSSH